MEKKYEVIFCIVNAGFADTVMDAARKEGASGGTVLKGRGLADHEAQKAFKINIQPEKELIMLLVPNEIKDAVLRSVNTFAGLDTDGQGIAFSLPVEHAIGLKDFQEADSGSAKKGSKK
ncbi:MAG: P-II family nitrogen regulator [Clostridiales bacterium]|nr:P-II family nitrogen regulator [Clostridiales bacterium]